MAEAALAVDEFGPILLIVGSMNGNLDLKPCPFPVLSPPFDGFSLSELFKPMLNYIESFL